MSAAGGTAEAASYLRVTQVRSAIGVKPKHRATLRALGLRGIGRSRVHEDRAELRGMLRRVPHLVEVAEASTEEAGRQLAVTEAGRRARAAGRGRGNTESHEESQS